MADSGEGHTDERALKVVPFKPPDDGPDAQTVRLLEEMLEQAKSGDIRGIAYTIIRRHTVIRTGWHISSGHERNAAIAGIDWLHARMVQSAFGEPD